MGPLACTLRPLPIVREALRTAGAAGQPRGAGPPAEECSAPKPPPARANIVTCRCPGVAGGGKSRKTLYRRIWRIPLLGHAGEARAGAIEERAVWTSGCRLQGAAIRRLPLNQNPWHRVRYGVPGPSPGSEVRLDGHVGLGHDFFVSIAPGRAVLQGSAFAEAYPHEYLAYPTPLQ